LSRHPTTAAHRRWSSPRIDWRQPARFARRSDRLLIGSTFSKEAFVVSSSRLSGVTASPSTADLRVAIFGRSSVQGGFPDLWPAQSDPKQSPEPFKSSGRSTLRQSGSNPQWSPQPQMDPKGAITRLRFIS